MWIAWIKIIMQYIDLNETTSHVADCDNTTTPLMYQINLSAFFDLMFTTAAAALHNFFVQSWDWFINQLDFFLIPKRIDLLIVLFCSD